MNNFIHIQKSDEGYQFISNTMLIESPLRFSISERDAFLLAISKKLQVNIKDVVSKLDELKNENQ